MYFFKNESLGQKPNSYRIFHKQKNQLSSLNREPIGLNLYLILITDSYHYSILCTVTWREGGWVSSYLRSQFLFNIISFKASERSERAADFFLHWLSESLTFLHCFLRLYRLQNQDKRKTLSKVESFSFLFVLYIFFEVLTRNTNIFLINRICFFHRIIRHQYTWYSIIRYSTIF